MPDPTCSVDGCSGSVQARGWCSKHYGRWRRRGTTELPKPQPLDDRLMRHARFDFDTGCIEWTACVDPDGYGRIKVDGQTRMAHRVAYEMFVGPIPEGLHLDHLCRNRKCINPHHLDPVSSLVNTRRGAGHGSETHCPQGHEYSGANLRISTDRFGYKHRHCRTCHHQQRR